MERFNIIFNRYIQYYLYGIVVLLIVFIFTYSPFILGLIIGTIGSLFNTFTFEYYLAKAKEKDNIHISTGNVWRYLIVVLACCIWYFYKAPDCFQSELIIIFLCMSIINKGSM